MALGNAGEEIGPSLSANHLTAIYAETLALGLRGGRF
jgi:hypothetical protein